MLSRTHKKALIPAATVGMVTSVIRELTLWYVTLIINFLPFSVVEISMTVGVK